MSTPTPEQLAALTPEYLAEDNSDVLLHVSIAFTVIITVVYVLFTISRVFCAERTGWETWTIYPIAYLLSLSLTVACIFFATIGGAGRHMAYWLINDPSVITMFLKLQTACESTYMAGITFPKVALLLLYLKIFTDRRIRILTWIVMAIVIGHFVFTGLIATFVICQPFAFKWDKTIPGGHCANLMAAYKYISIPNILTDVAIALLPASTLRRLQTSTKRKVGLVLTFFLGSMGIITSIIRFVGFYTVDLESDLTYLGMNTMIYTMVEPCAYFICSCLPGIRPLAVAIYKKSGQATASTSTKFWRTKSSEMKTSHGISLGSYPGGHKTSIVASSKAPSGQTSDADTRNFIRLEETFDVDFNSAASSRRDPL